MSSTPQKSCQICGASNVFNHYGAISCRACGAFFRRLVTLGVNYECAFKNGQSKVHSIGSNIVGCKGCRQRKCIEAGMKREMVRAVGLQSFRRQFNNRSMNENEENFCELKFTKSIKSEGCSFSDEFEMKGKFFQSLLRLCNTAEKFHSSIHTVPMEYFDEFDSLEALLMSTNNLLTNSAKIIQEVHNSSFDKKEFLEFVRKNGIFSLPNPMITVGLLVCLNLAKTLPAFEKLDLVDKVCLIENSTMPSLFLFTNYFSAKTKAGTLVNSEGMCIFPVYAQQYDDPIITAASERIFHHPLFEFLRVELTKEEFALLTAMLFSNSAIPDISAQAQQILKGEEEKYGKMLLGLQQRRFGENAGALRYMETLQLLWATIGQTQKHREIAIYIDSLYEQGKFEKIVPKALQQLIL